MDKAVIVGFAAETVRKNQHLYIMPGSEERPCSGCGKTLLMAPSSLELQRQKGYPIVCIDCAPKDGIPVATRKQIEEAVEAVDRMRRRN